MALEFDGINDIIDCGSSATIDNIFDAGATLTGWIFIDVMEQAAMVAKPSGDGWAMFIESLFAGVNNVLHFTKAHVTANGHWRTPANSISVSVWTHVAVAYTSGAANDPVIYVNGVSQTITETTTPNGASVSDAAGNLALADYAAAPVIPLDGRLEDVRLFNRLVTAEEAAILAAGYRGPLGGEVGWWSLEDASNLTAAWDGLTLVSGTHVLPDRSDNTNNGTPTNSPVARAGDAPRMGAMI